MNAILIHYVEVVLYPIERQVAEIGSLVVQGKIKVIVDRVFPLADATGANAQLEHGHSRGKTILEIV